MALDDIVTVTTTLAHVCGALGRHAYVLVPQGPQWRYQYPCNDGLWWYPESSVEMFRQAKGEIGWEHVVKRVAKAREQDQEAAPGGVVAARLRLRHRAWRKLRAAMSNRTIAYRAINSNTGRQKLFNGLTDPGFPSALASGNFVYCDNGYFDRANHFRLIRGNVHLTTLLDRPGDRWDRLGIKPRPWRANGNQIVIIPPSEWYVQLMKCKGWLAYTRNTLEKHTKRPIVVKHGKGGLEAGITGRLGGGDLRLGRRHRSGDPGHPGL